MVKRRSRTARRLKMKRIKRINWIAIAVAILVTAGAWTAWAYLATRTNQAKVEQHLETKIKELDTKKSELEKLNLSNKQLEDQQKKLEEEKVQLEKKLEAKRNSAVAYAAALPTAFQGNCVDWVTQAGISDVESAMALIRGESGCNPKSVNSSSGACGVAQELPCGKSGCQLGDGACQIRWMDGYVKNRYGTWANAYATWSARSPHWY